MGVGGVMARGVRSSRKGVGGGSEGCEERGQRSEQRHKGAHKYRKPIPAKQNRSGDFEANIEPLHCLQETLTVHDQMGTYQGKLLGKTSLTYYGKLR